MNKNADLITARANHATCLLAVVMRDCEHCKFKPVDYGLLFLDLADNVAIAITPKVARYMDDMTDYLDLKATEEYARY